MNHIFISYSRRDSAFVNRIADLLRKEEIPVWQDISGKSSGIPFSTKWFSAIEEALHTSAGALVFRSENWEKSVPCRKEFAIVENLAIPCFEVDTNRTYDEAETEQLLADIRTWCETDVYGDAENDLRTWLLSSLNAHQNRRSLNTGIPHYKTKEDSDAFLERLQQCEKMAKDKQFDSRQPKLYKDMRKFLKRAARITRWDRIKRPLAAGMLALLLALSGVSYLLSARQRKETSQHLAALRSLDSIHTMLSRDPLQALIMMAEDDNDYGDYIYLLFENYADALDSIFPSAFLNAASMDAQLLASSAPQQDAGDYQVLISEDTGSVEVVQPKDREYETSTAFLCGGHPDTWAVQGDYLCVSHGQDVFLFDMPRARDAILLEGCCRNVRDLRFDGQGRICAITESGDVFIWDNPFKEMLCKPDEAIQKAIVPVYSDGRLEVSSTPQGTLLIRDVRHDAVIASCSLIREPLQGVYLDETGIVYAQGVSGTWYQKDFSKFFAGYTDDPLMQKKQYDEEVRRLCAFLHDSLQITDLSLSE